MLSYNHRIKHNQLMGSLDKLINVVGYYTIIILSPVLVTFQYFAM